MFILKVYIHLPCINTQRQTTSTFNNTTVISSSDHLTTGLYQGSEDRCDGYRNSDLISLLQQYQAIQYCNQSVLDIFPDLNIFILSITIVDIISRSALVRFSLLRASYLYKLTGISSTYSFGISIVSFWSPLSRVSALYWYYKNTVLRFVWYRFAFIEFILKFIYIHPESTQREEQHHHLTTLPSYHLSATKRQDFIRGQPIVVRIS